MIAALLKLLEEALGFLNAGGAPEKLNDWLNGKLVELQKMRADLKPPDAPDA